MLHYRGTMVALGLLLAAGVLACTVDLGLGQASKPAVEIVSPPSGSRVALGEDVEVVYRATDAVAVVRVELEIDGRTVAVDSSPVAEGQPSMTGILRWTPTTPGVHRLLVYSYNRDGMTSDAVGLSITVTSPSPTPVPATPTSELAPATPVPPTPTDTPVPSTPVPPTPTDTSVPPTPAATPTHTLQPATPVPPTPTHTPMSCPMITINVPSHAWPSRAFTLEWDASPHALPSGWQWGIRFKGDEASWTHLPVPLEPSAREEGGHWKADQLEGRGVEETLHWQVCLVDMSDPARTFQCCGPVPPWPIIHTR